MNNTIFDDVFRTMLEKMPRLVIPLLNEVFDTAYPEDVQIVQKSNEHETKSGEVITDSHLLIGNRIYHLECQSTDDSTMILRMIEYDFAIGLEYAEKENGRYCMRMPHSCVLYLRGGAGADHMEMELILPDGTSVAYRVPVIRMEAYTSDVIFQKHLLFLLPFYIIRYEKKQKRIAGDEKLLQALLAEYAEMERHLESELLERDREKDFRDLIELINRIADYIFAKSDVLRKELGEVMGGKVLELKSDKLIAEGIAEGENAKAKRTAMKMHQKGYTTSAIAELLEESVQTVSDWLAEPERQM